jgi:hypothetical protein
MARGNIMSALYIVKSPAASLKLKRDGIRALVLALHDVVAVLHEATPPAGRFRWSSVVSAAGCRPDAHGCASRRVGAW